jgi:hypothetical protein
MNKTIIITLLVAYSLLSTAQDPQPRNLLTGKISAEELSGILISAEDWHPYPTIDEPEAWDQYPEYIRTFFINEGERYFEYTWPVIPATAALDFVRSGNRTNYESVSFKRRQVLALLVMAELFERQGRFIDQIINGIWAICEETYWGVSAHIGAQKRGAGLPDVTEPTIDLFAAETSCQLAWVLYLVGSRLDIESPLIRERIEYEIQRRILIPGLDRDDFWWMGYHGQSLNNWTPWICSNWLPSVMLIENDPERQAAAIYKIMTILDNFLNPYPADGGCDEGPGYWDKAGGSLLDCLDDLRSVTGGRIDIFNEPLVKNMGLYMLRAYISYPYYINFADASARINADPFLIYRYGKDIGSKDLMDFGAFLAVREWTGPENLVYSFGALGRRQLPALFICNDVLGHEGREPLLSDVWLPDIQVMAARSDTKNNEGLYIAAKGGHNDESHNHNDVGNFIVYLNGKPAIIDIGVETYRRQTFSDERYTIWTMQSAYHNLPTLNGKMQLNGREYKAENVICHADKKNVNFAMNLEKAYPEDAGIQSLRRTIDFKRGKEIAVRDEYQFTSSDNQVAMNLITHFLVKENKKGQIVLQSRNNPEDLLYIHFNDDIFSVETEKIPVTDTRLNTVWGDELIRLIFFAQNIPDQFEYTFLIQGK